MSLHAHDVTLSDDADDALTRLEKSRDPKAKSIAKRARALGGILRRDALHGEVVKKPLPAALVKKHGIENLYVEDLPDFWRFLYTIVRVGHERNVVVIEIVDHAQYDKWFG